MTESEKAKRIVQVANALGVEAGVSARPAQARRLVQMTNALGVAVANEIEVEARD